MTTDVPFVFVTLGTDHHRFDRVVGWIDGWLARNGAPRARVLVQRGSSRAPQHAESREYLGSDEMEDTLRRADVVVTHGGPGSIMEARTHGFTPIAVPRRRALGEHVDDHQVPFVERMDRLGMVRAAQDGADLHRLLDAAVTDPSAFRFQAAPTDVTPAIERFERLVGRLDAPIERPGERLRILYIGGVGRSGTTLLDRMLGGLRGVCSVGELVHIWIRGLQENVLCGCGRPFHDCPFWQEVGERAFGGWKNLDPEAVTRDERMVRRHRYVPMMMMPGLFPTYDNDLREFASLFPPMYRAIRDVSGKGDLIVDSSKDASQVFLLRRLPNVDLRVVQMVRRSHGVAYSWSKLVRRPEVPDREVFMQQYHPWRIGARWLTYNLMFDLVKRLGVPTMLLRYEDLVRDPARQVQRVSRFAGIDLREDDLGFVQNGAVELPATHSVSGNPMRFRKGPAPLRLDDEWRTGMGPGDRAVVTATTWPLLARYGYLRSGDRP